MLAGVDDGLDRPESRAKLKAYGIAPPARVDGEGSCSSCARGRRLSVRTVIRARRRCDREFGSTACKSVCWCRACGQPFEEFKAI